MHLLINDEELDFTLENEKTLGDILHAVESELEGNMATITSIAINGQLLKANEIDEAEMMTIDKLETVNLSCVSQDDIYNTLKKLCFTFETMIPSIQEIPVLLQGGHDNKARAVISTFADTFDFLCRTVTLSSLFPDKFGKMCVDGLLLPAFLADFAPILKDFESALQDGDTVLVGDLSEYEIAPRLEKLSAFGKTI